MVPETRIEGTESLPEEKQTMFGGPLREADDADLSPKLVGFRENDVKARSFKLLRTALSRQMSDKGHKIVGITSPSPAAGKSFIASNLAASMSNLPNHRVVLADLDLQRASIADLFGMAEGPGLVDFLAGNTESLAEVARLIGKTRLTVLPTFLNAMNSAELLAGDRFAEFIKILRASDDATLIICDLPPLFVSDDAMLAAQQLDGVLLVVEQGVTTRKQVEASLQMLYPLKIFGTIFNRYSGGFADPYGYSGGYGSYYTKD